VAVDFDVDKTLATMTAIVFENKCLIAKASDGTLRLLPLDQACVLLDQIWDNLYQYNQ
jgi:hypothetical protein